jgi:hypothetical protein
MHVEVTLETGESCTTQVSTNGDSPFLPGDSVHLYWNPSDELRFE